MFGLTGSQEALVVFAVVVGVLAFYKGQGIDIRLSPIRSRSAAATRAARRAGTTAARSRRGTCREGRIRNHHRRDRRPRCGGDRVHADQEPDRIECRRCRRGALLMPVRRFFGGPKAANANSTNASGQPPVVRAGLGSAAPQNLRTIPRPVPQRFRSKVMDPAIVIAGAPALLGGGAGLYAYARDNAVGSGRRRRARARAARRRSTRLR